MIWNDATNVIWNGSTVNAVICNGAQIWPKAEPTPDAWTMFSIYTYNNKAKSSQVGFDIFDSTHRKVYSTEGLHDISSYGSADAVASGIAPFYVSLSGSGCPYDVLAAKPGNSLNTGLISRRSDTQTPGSLVVTTAQLRDSKTHSSTFPTSVEAATLSNVSYMSARGYNKLLNVSGRMVANWLPTGSTGSASGVLILTTFDVPWQAELPPYDGDGFTSTAYPSVSADPTGLSEPNVPAGYFFYSKSARMIGNDYPNKPAFNFFSDVSHSGYVTASVQNMFSHISATIGAPGYGGGLFSNNIVSGSSTNPYASYTGEYPTLMYLSGKDNFQASASKIPTYYDSGTYRLTDAQCGKYMYYGYFGTNPYVPMKAFSMFARTATSTTDQTYTASVIVE